MRSRVVSFRVPDDLYEEYERKCKDEGVSPAIRLREFVESVCHPTKVEDTDASGNSEKPIETDKVNTDNEARVKVIKVEGEKQDKVTNKKVKP